MEPTSVATTDGPDDIAPVTDPTGATGSEPTADGASTLMTFSPTGDAAAGGAGGGPVGNPARVTLAEVRDATLSIDECVSAVMLPEVGGIALFVGVVRDNDHGRPVTDLAYEAHPRAEVELARVAADVAARAGAHAVAVTHRTGHLHVGDVAVVVAVGAAHRGEAFAACRRLIDDIKSQVPIWKHQIFADGAVEWVGAC